MWKTISFWSAHLSQWGQTGFKQSFWCWNSANNHWILISLVTIVYLIHLFHLLIYKPATWVSQKSPLKGHRVTGYRNLSRNVLGNAKSFFCFLLEMAESSPKRLFKIPRCFRSHRESLFESFQSVTEISRMMVTIQNRIILNSFSTQVTITI